MYVDGESKQYFVKRFQIETNTLDKEFGFISEGIGSRLEFVTTSDAPEVEVELVKGKGKGKETEVVNLEDIIDVKGWKALGNRLSQHKVTNVKAVEEPEDTGLEDGDDENELIEATETVKGSQSQKKKSEMGPEPKANTQKPKADRSQVNLFEHPKGQEQKATSQPPRPKTEKVVQASLFGENNAEKVRDRQKPKQGNKKPKAKGHPPTVFTAGQTIELEL